MLAIATVVLGPLANGPLAADVIQNAPRSGKLTWRTPKVAGEPTTSPMSTSQTPTAQTSASERATQRDTADVFDREPAEDARPAKTFTRSASRSSSSSSSTSSSAASSTGDSSLRVRGADSSTRGNADFDDDTQQEITIDQAPARPSVSDLDRPTSKASRIDRAARPYSRKATASSKAIAARQGTVQRLSEADPSPFSSGEGDAAGSSLSIVQVSAVKEVTPPAIVPEDELRLSVRERELIDQAGLQEGAEAQPSPFDNEPRRAEPDPFNTPPKDQLAQGGLLPGRCPTPKDLKPLDQISINIAAEPGPFPAECGLGDETFVPRDFACTTLAWKASALCHKPLYFEDWDLERYGHTASPLLQPFISAAQFYLVLPILPYKMGLEPPGECIYALGYYRPGSCAPRIIPNVPISLRGALLEAGVWVAGVALVP